MSETTVVQLRRFGTKPLLAHKLASLSLFKMVTLCGHPLSLHPIYKRPKGLFSINVFYMNPSLCLCKPSSSGKQSPIEAELLNLWPDGFPTPRQSGELQFVPESLSSALAPFLPSGLAQRGRDNLFPLSQMEKEMTVWNRNGCTSERVAWLQWDTFPQALPGRKTQQENGREDVPFFLRSQAYTKKWDGTVVWSQIKDDYYNRHWESGKWKSFLNWKSLFM